MNSILCNTHATTIFIAYHISNSRKKPLRGADFLTSKQISIFPSSFLKKAAADLKKAKVNAGAAVNSSVNMRFFSAWKNSKTLPGFFLASGFSQFVRWNMHLYIGQNSAVGEELIYENKALIMNGTFDE